MIKNKFEEVQDFQLMIDYPENPPVLTTDRLSLVPVSIEHRHDLFSMFSDPDVAKPMGIAPMKEISEIEEWYEQYEVGKTQKSHLEWAILSRGKGEFLGRCGLTNINWVTKKAEISCALQKEAWGKKFAFDALGSVLEYAFSDLNLKRIEAQLWPNNMRMLKVLERLGFNREGILKKNYFYNGNFGDSAIYGLWNKKLTPSF